MRKIIQIAVTSHELNPDDDSIYALCDDGTLWQNENRVWVAREMYMDWVQLTNIPQTENETIKKAEEMLS